MSEKEKAKAVLRARSVQPNESSEIKSLQEIIEENEAHEAQLYAQRGYGGYINSEHIEAIRKATWEAVQKIEALRKKTSTD